VLPKGSQSRTGPHARPAQCEMMVARKKNTKNKAKKKGKRQSALRGPGPVIALKVLVVVCIFGGIAVGIVYWNGSIKQKALASPGNVPIELAAEPAWVNKELEQKLYTAATADGRGLKLDETAARRVQENIETLFGWLADVKVQTMHNRLAVRGRWRKPLVLVKLGLQRFYVDRELVVLDFVEMPELLIVPVKGLAVMPDAPNLGQPWRRDDLAAAVELAEMLNKWDRDKTPDKPLLREIAAIDVSNYNGRENKRFPHIVLYTTDNTEVIWGAELGKWQRHLEATDAEKLAKLYAYYQEYGSLLGDVKYINLRDPQDKIPLPIDK